MATKTKSKAKRLRGLIQDFEQRVRDEEMAGSKTPEEANYCRLELVMSRTVLLAYIRELNLDGPQ